MKYDLTLKKIKNTSFSTIYNRFIIGDKLTSKEFECILALAVCFTNAEDVNVQRLGYRIIVEYCNSTSDYAPLYEITINKGLYPICKFIELHHLPKERRNFFTEWNDAFLEQYSASSIYQSEQQKGLVDFFSDNKKNTISVIAPTSYGKSELILSAIQEYAGKKVCVITSTKALLMQTKKRIKEISKGLFPKIVVHPEMYNPKDSACLAVLTQERLLRVFKKNPNLSFDCFIVDEAHELLENKSRSRILADVIIVAQKRNRNTAFKFLTPFIENETNLQTRYTSYDVEAFKVNEYIKTEKYYLYDFRNTKQLLFYDQFLNDYIPMTMQENINSEESFVKAYASEKNIIYLNKPTDIESFSLALADVLPDIKSKLILEACDNISRYLQPQYNMLKCLRKGIIYHHGSVPDVIRIYVEDLYKKEQKIKFIITSSTLLSGVNIPADKMFILDNRKGASNLTHDSFRNLIGRVCRFSEIFSSVDGTLKRLEPQIYLVFGNYFSKKANCKEFLKKVAKVDIKYKDTVKNVLLENTDISSENLDIFQKESEFIENYENGIVANYHERYTKTNVGKSCIMNGITEIDVFKKESEIQRKVDKYISDEVKASDASMLMDIIYDMFIKYVSDDNRNLKRLVNCEARNFYVMMLNWKLENKSYAEMIGLFVRYWKEVYKNNNDAIIFVGKWGNFCPQGKNVNHYTKLKNKTTNELVNLAIVRIKEEQDFIDNILTKYIEVLYDLSLLENDFYTCVKYGTSDEETICLLKNGLSISSANLLLKKYRKYIEINIEESIVYFDEALISEMFKEKENEIIICEIQGCM
ncbi:DEAD/DEAH box helicase [Holdemanella porci]|uniref:DEAD/DEAH box helicase n=1 Tax=Holdemanella porci TaxID=2652276 RepID=UPI0038902219